MLVVEVIEHLSPSVKQKIIKSGYTLQDVAKEIVLNIWQYSIHSKPDLAIVFNDLRNQPSHCRLQKFHYDHNLSIITDIVFGLKLDIPGGLTRGFRRM
ncbi:hypothetical protein SAMN06265348_11935 [Pedobacter westerhofensis]|uniref:Uncharacterized protein n=1 Tax=Pedobacter westerhofensis TaxID=425512 RepID=A0A521FS10_9SPHI|nr:hypothetical protein SAMN06265348_11935 [Pedobacter westerhofensis]